MNRHGASFVLFSILVVLILVVVTGSSSALQARRATPCDGSSTHGVFTDSMCPQDALWVNAYMESSNGRFRLYYQADGSVAIYDISDYPNFVLVSSLFPGNGDPSHLVYGDIEHDSWGSNTANVALWDSADNLYAGDGSTPDGSNFFRLDSDGCARIYDQDGNRVLRSFGGCS
jgi:hypothetical protein